jgi:hypothetical protein
MMHKSMVFNDPTALFTRQTQLSYMYKQWLYMYSQTQVPAKIQSKLCTYFTPACYLTHLFCRQCQGHWEVESHR